ncbi:MAG: serine/threonine-protein kinase [Cyanobacteria bacterium J06636_16]
MHEAQQTGAVIQSRYRILSVLGQGGSGITYEAEDNQTGLHVALKELSLRGLSDWKKLELFEREAQILKQLDYPAIPDYLDYFQVDIPDNRLFYIVQALAEGQSLADLVAAGERFPETEVRRIAIEVLETLQYLHGLNPPVIHRDIKPQNIIRREDGHISLVDFGAVQMVYRETAAFSSTVVGTYGYMPPEQFRGQAFPQTDLYGLGATLLHLLTHRHPADLPQRRLRYDFRRYVNLSKPFAQWLDGMLEPLAEDRFDFATTAMVALTNPPPKRIQHIANRSQELPLRRKKPLGSLINITRNRWNLYVSIPSYIEKTDFLGCLGCFISVVGNLVFLWLSLAMTEAMGATGLIMSLFIVLPSLGITVIALKKIKRVRKVFTSLAMDAKSFTLVDERHWSKAVIKGCTKDIISIELSSPYPTSDKSREAILIREEEQVHQFGSHLTTVEKKWILSEIQTYLQDRRQFNLFGSP